MSAKANPTLGVITFGSLLELLMFRVTLMKLVRKEATSTEQQRSFTAKSTPYFRGVETSIRVSK